MALFQPLALPVPFEALVLSDTTYTQAFELNPKLSVPFCIQGGNGLEYKSLCPGKP